MPLNDTDQKQNASRLQPIISDLLAFFFPSLETTRKLSFFEIHLLTLLNFNETVLQLDDRRKNLQTLLMRLVGTDDQNVMERELHHWVTQYIKQEREKKFDISMSIIHNVAIGCKSGSVRDFEHALRGIIQAPKDVTDRVAIVTPLDRTQKTPDDVSFERMLINSIKYALTNNTTKTLLIPVLCEGSIWRLIITEINKKRQVQKAILWDPILHVKPVIRMDAMGTIGVQYDKDTQRLMGQVVFSDLREVAQGFNAKISEKNIVPYVATKISDENRYLSMDFVIRKALQLTGYPGLKEICKEKEPVILRNRVYGLIREGIGLFERNKVVAPQPEVVVDLKGKKRLPDEEQVGFRA